MLRTAVLIAAVLVHALAVISATTLSQSWRAFLGLIDYPHIYSNNAHQDQSLTAGTDIIVFGDSLSDSGNLKRLTFGFFPRPKDTYFDGRLTNGKLWPEYIVHSRNDFRVINFALGGTTACMFSGTPVFALPQLSFQTSKYNDFRRNHKSRRKVFILEMGGVDYIGRHLFKPQLSRKNTPTDVVNCMMRQVRKLQSSGAESVVVMNLPPLYVTPAIGTIIPAEEKETLENTVREHNRVLEEAIEKENQKSESSKIHVFDVHGFFLRILESPSDYGFKITDKSCVVMNRQMDKEIDRCLNPDIYLHWDPLHPTTRAHYYWAEDLLSFLVEKKLVK